MEDILQKIYTYIPYKTRWKFIINKQIRKIYFDDLRKINKIQKFYRSVRLNKNYLVNPEGSGDHYNPSISYNKWNRFLLYRFYILEYPEEYLYTYPNFLVNKLYSNSNTIRSQNLYTWLQNNSFEQKKRYVKKFFVENKITSKEIMIAGW